LNGSEESAVLQECLDIVTCAITLQPEDSGIVQEP
jgi:hypothetical protein